MPPAIIVTTLLATVHTAGVFDVMTTVSPESEAAAGMNGGSPSVAIEGCPKVINCGDWFTVCTVALDVLGICAASPR